jgi:hypothetical protein
MEEEEEVFNYKITENKVLRKLYYYTLELSMLHTD